MRKNHSVKKCYQKCELAYLSVENNSYSECEKSYCSKGRHKILPWGKTKGMKGVDLPVFHTFKSCEKSRYIFVDMEVFLL